MESLLTPSVSLTEQVRDYIRKGILQGKYKQGQPLVEREIAAELSVSKTPVREGLKLLQPSGLVVFSSYERVIVRRVDADTVQHVFGARLEVEPRAVRLNAEKGEGARDEARLALKEASAANKQQDPATEAAANRKFHRALYEGCGNPYLVDFLDRIQDLTQLITVSGWQRWSTQSKDARQHRAILTAVEKADAARAESLMFEHISKGLSRAPESWSS
jgi:DNA-binding GntR family transcriptional regulator